MAEERFAQIADHVREQFEHMDKLREQAYALSREIVRNSATAIRMVHRGELDKADELMRRNTEALAKLRPQLEGLPALLSAGFVQDAMKEHAEANLTRCLACDLPFPTPEEIAVDGAPYLNGMAEALTEMRRHIIDKIRQGELEQCEAWLARMDDVYYELMTFDYPDAISQGLKRRLDTVRTVIERTRSDLTTAIRQRALEEQMARLEELLRRRAE